MIIPIFFNFIKVINMQSNNSVQSFEDISFHNLSQETIDSICCSVSLFPYKKAQIVNCQGNHSFSLESVYQIFGEMKKVGNEDQCEKPGPCPLCRGKVTSYRPNPALQSIVDSIIRLKKEEVHPNKMYEVIRKLKIDFNKEVKYPLQKETFQLRSPITEFTSNWAGVYLDNSLGIEALPPGHIETIHFEVEVIEKKCCFTGRVFLSDKNSLLILFEYLEKNEIFTKMCSFRNFLYLEFIWGYNKSKEFLSCVYLFTQPHELDSEVQESIKNLLEFVESASQK